MPRAFEDTPDSDVIVDTSNVDVLQYQQAANSLGWFFQANDAAFPGKFYQDTEEIGSNGCWVTFPFTGNRVAVYGFVSAGQSSSTYDPTQASFSIDGMQKTMYTSDFSTHDRHNVQFYQSDLLPSGEHLLTITVEHGGVDAFILDWIEYNTTRASEPLTSTTSSTTMSNSGSHTSSNTSSSSTSSTSANLGSSSPTSSPPPPVSSKASVPIGAIVSGVIGGLAFIFVAIIAFILWRRRQRLRSIQPDSLVKEEGRPDLFSTAAPYHGPVSLAYEEAATPEPSTTGLTVPASTVEDHAVLSVPSPTVTYPSAPPQLGDSTTGWTPSNSHPPVDKASHQPEFEVEGSAGAGSSTGASGSGDGQPPPTVPPPMHSLFDDDDDLDPDESPPAYTP